MRAKAVPVWVELVSRLFGDAVFAPPVGQERIGVAAARLGGTFPGDLTALLSETDGVRGEFLVDVVWEVDRIVEVNLDFRSRTDFVGDRVVVWEHETDIRREVADDLRDYLARSLTSGGDDWYVS